MPDRHLEFWYEYGSTYTYLTVARIASVAEAQKILVDWRPFLLMPILIEQGMQRGPFLPYPNKLRYMWRDVERRALRHNIPYQKPFLYPPNTLSTARIGYLAQSQHWCADFTQEVFRLHWTEGVIIGTDENIRRSLNFVGQDPDRIVSMAQRDDNKTGLRRQTEQAKALGIFGSPTFVVGNELFWGDDRLEDALDFAAGRF
ncbi:2-hydroxychromene-2-carboxylate isomerase [Bradyrhizobium sp. RDI18]|uniref:2-hydroxychromene-2-carboxylate isomerase n=1 Tax=Bradyrhizobium sp. RDI18 TaxID=3367400 RepID=UPI003718814A